ncbi:MAG: cupin domain-containing protein [Rhodobacteraceae bacterium]|nr:cupin domain-containing protein [Paracoccaceae bacterium]
MTFDTGARLRELREARGLSQRQLAAAAGVTGAMISLIEQNRTSPSVATLKKILSGLELSLGAFFAEEESGEAKWYFAHGELREITPTAKMGDPANGAPNVRFLQVGRPGGSALQMLFERYPPGADTGAELYSHDAEEAGIVVSGEIEITVGTETRRLGAGDGYLFNSRIAHRFRNRGTEDCVIVSACTPPTF